MAAREPLPPGEEAGLARLVIEGKATLSRLAQAEVAAEERKRLEEVAEEGREAALVQHNLPLVSG